MAKKKQKKKPFKVSITKKMVKKATLLVVNTLVAKAIKSGLLKRKHMHIVVGFIDGTVVYEYSLGNTKEWENDYEFVANSKFDDTVNAQKPSRRIQSESPHMATGKVPYYGSWIDIDNGIVVAVSGVQPFWDEAISKMIIAAIMAFVYEEQEQLLAA